MGLFAKRQQIPYERFLIQHFLNTNKLYKNNDTEICSNFNDEVRTRTTELKLRFRKKPQQFDYVRYENKNNLNTI